MKLFLSACFRRFLRLAVCLTFLMAMSIDARIWTDKHGRQIEAELLEILDKEVRIKRSDGREYQVEISTFSQTDRDFIESQREMQSDGHDETDVEESWEGWPRALSFHRRPSVEIVEESGDRFIYRTPHFEFQSDVRLSRNLVAELGHVFETTHAALNALPLNLLTMEPGSSHFTTRLFSHAKDYYQAGGIPGSSGLYSPQSRAILIPTENLGVKESSSGFTLDRYAHNRVLIHEITHQVMDPWLFRIPVWLTEGMAVYMEAAARKRGEFEFSSRTLEDYLLRHTPYLNGPLSITPLKELMGKSYPEWNSAFQSGPETTARNYYSALLLTYYFFHLDDDPARVRRFLRIHDPHVGVVPSAAQEVLLGERDYDELQNDLLRKFRRIGIRLTVD